jgi:hypothetical protein
LGVKRPGREAGHSPPSSAEVKECVELYLHSPIRLHSVVLYIYIKTGKRGELQEAKIIPAWLSLEVTPLTLKHLSGALSLRHTSQYTKQCSIYRYVALGSVFGCATVRPATRQNCITVAADEIKEIKKR